MRQKEYQLHYQLITLCIALRNTALRNSRSKVVEEVDHVLEKLDALQNFNFDDKGAELKKNGFTLQTKISWKKSILSVDELPKQAKLGACYFVENTARYYAKGSKKWVLLPQFYVERIKSNKNRMEDFLLEGV